MGVNGNGFTDREIVALLGAHSIGETRNHFNGPWVPNDGAFGNDYMKILERVHNEHSTDPFNQAPFETNLFTWWQDQDLDVCTERELAEGKCTRGRMVMMLDSDAALEVDAGFHEFVAEFAASESIFFQAFHDAYVKMSQIGFHQCTPQHVGATPPGTQFAVMLDTKWSQLWYHGMQRIWDELKPVLRSATEVDPEFMRTCPVHDDGTVFTTHCKTTITSFAPFHSGFDTPKVQIEVRFPVAHESERAAIHQATKVALPGGRCFLAAFLDGSKNVCVAPTGAKFLDTHRQGEVNEGDTEYGPNTPTTTSAPTQTHEHAGVSGDPFVVDGRTGARVQFFLPLQEDVHLLTCDSMKLYGRAFGSQIVGDHQQWFDRFRVSVDGEDQLLVGVAKNMTRIPNHDDNDIGSNQKTDARLSALNVEVEGNVMGKTGAVGTTLGSLVAAWRTDAAEIVQLSSGTTVLQMKSAVAQKFTEKHTQRLYTHLDLTFIELQTSRCSSGVLAEIWGMAAMSQATAAMLQPPQSNGH